MSSAVDSSFKNIQVWKDVTPFADSVVAYQTTHFYFGATEAYPINNNFFGYIEKSPRETSIPHKIGLEKYFRMVRMLKPDACSGVCSLADSTLDTLIAKNALSIDSFVRMRFATKEEIALIRKAIESKEVIFDYSEHSHDDECINKVLEKYLLKLSNAEKSASTESKSENKEQKESKNDQQKNS